MQHTEQALPDELQYYFVVKQAMPDSNTQVILSSYAPFREDQTTFPFDSEVDAALYLLEQIREARSFPPTMWRPTG